MSTVFDELCRSIQTLGMYGRRPGRELTRELLVHFDHPERGHRIIHIAGTNGKGSTAWYTAGLLAKAGYTVGLYTSPHLVRMTERIRLNGREISDADFIRLGQSVLQSGLEMTASDVLLLIAIRYFTECACDYIVIETGLGGRYDSTNALTDPDMGGAAELAVLTRIDLDHTAILGDTLSDIAGEKAGIIKPHTTVVLAENPPEVEDIISRHCAKCGALLYKTREAADIDNWIAGFFPQLYQTYQRENLANAVLALRLLEPRQVTHRVDQGKEAFLLPDADRIKDGITPVPGRLQVICREPLVIVDGAHNPSGARALADSLAAVFPDRQFDCVIGIVRDKDADGILAPMLGWMRSASVVEVGDAERRTDGEALCRMLTEKGVPARLYGSFAEAYRWLSGRRQPQGIVVFGSLYLVREAIPVMEDGDGISYTS